MTLYRSPVDGAVLQPAGPHALAGRCRRWPVVDGIPYLRTGRDALADAALAHLDAGRQEQALALLLADQDDWWSGPVPQPDALATLIAQRQTLSLREAMRLLQWGRVGDYFAHRWTDPTFLAGLALVEAHWTAPRSAFELACGIGHHLRALAQQGVAVTGGDVVFAKLWVARHWVVPQARLVCFDAGGPWPLQASRFELACCHDAFYFLAPKQHVLDSLRGLSDGAVLIGHIHNRDWPNLSAGAAMRAAELAAMAPDGVLFDDAELTAALIERRAPQATGATVRTPRRHLRQDLVAGCQLGDGVCLGSRRQGQHDAPMHDVDIAVERAGVGAEDRDHFALNLQLRTRTGMTGDAAQGVARRDPVMVGGARLVGAARHVGYVLYGARRVTRGGTLCRGERRRGSRPRSHRRCGKRGCGRHVYRQRSVAR